MIKAPEPNDVLWENLKIPSINTFIRTWTFNIILALICLFGLGHLMLFCKRRKIDELGDDGWGAFFGTVLYIVILKLVTWIIENIIKYIPLLEG